MQPRDEMLRPAEVIRRLRLCPDAVVADIGAGTAYFTTDLAAAVPQGRVIATDIRPVSIGIIYRRALAAGRSNVETLTADRDHCRLEPNSIDLAFLCQVDHHLDDRVAYLRTVVDALRPGGRIAIINIARLLRLNQHAGRDLGLEVVDEWWPSAGYFLLVHARPPAPTAGTA
jgi:ubiquinone/menaquinone biosynthesis C-methylase UbiE